MTRHIAVVGGGYAGTMALGRLRMQEPSARLTLIDPGTHFEARIHLHRVAAGGTGPHLAYETLCQAWNAEHRRERLVGIDGRLLTLSHSELEPDAVILALGSRTQPAPGPAHRLDDDASARCIREALAANPKARVTVVGAGTTALEVATALAAAHSEARITVWRSGGWQSTPAGNHRIEGRLQQLGVHVLNGGRVIGVDGSRCWSDTHELGHDEVIWCAGFEITRVPGLVPGHADGRIAVDPFLHLGDGVFAAGDLAAPPTAHRMGCVTAMPTGAHAAGNVSRWLRGEALEPFRFRDMLTCLDLGAGHGLVSLLDAHGDTTRVFGGPIAGFTKASILLWVRGFYAAERRTGRPLYGWVKSDAPLLQERP